MLGQFEFSGFEARPRGQVKIDVTFEIDADGILSVTARDQDSGQQASTTITLNSGLSDAEMGGIIDEGRADRVVSSRPEAPAAPPVASAAPVAAAAPVATAPPTAPPPLPSPDPGEAILMDDGSDDLIGDLDADLTSGTPITEPIAASPLHASAPPSAARVMSAADAELIGTADAYDDDELVAELEIEPVAASDDAIVELEAEPAFSELDTQPEIAAGYDDDILIDDDDTLVGGEAALFETDEVGPDRLRRCRLRWPRSHRPKSAH